MIQKPTSEKHNEGVIKFGLKSDWDTLAQSSTGR